MELVALSQTSWLDLAVLAGPAGYVQVQVCTV